RPEVDGKADVARDLGGHQGPPPGAEPGIRGAAGQSAVQEIATTGAGTALGADAGEEETAEMGRSGPGPRFAGPGEIVRYHDAATAKGRVERTGRGQADQRR